MSAATPARTRARGARRSAPPTSARRARGSPSSRTDTRARRPSARRRSPAGRSPWKPSQPAIRSASRTCSASSCTYRTTPVDGSTRTSETSKYSALRARIDQVLDDLLLPVDRDRAAGQIGQRDPVPLAVEAQLDAVVDEPLGVHARAEARPRPSGPSSPARARPRARAAARTRDRAPRGSRSRSPAARATARASTRPARRRRSPLAYAWLDDTVRQTHSRSLCEHTPRSHPSPTPLPTSSMTATPWLWRASPT